MVKITFAFLGAVSLAAACSPRDGGIAAPVRSDLAPTGTLRAGINHGNPILAQKDPATGELRGITVDLSRELGRRIGVPVALVPYDAAGKMTDALKDGAWDVAFLAVDPARAAEISFTAPYLEIEGTYLVPEDSPIRSVADADREGVRIAAGAKSAYDLFLSRNLQRAQIVRAPTALEAVDLFASERLDAVAGVRQALAAAAARLPGTRVVDGRFMVIEQAAGTPRGRDAGAAYLHEFIEEAKASGLVAELLKKSGVGDSATVAPLAASR
jgi:polar amino acid transport system substrate-binding protein